MSTFILLEWFTEQIAIRDRPLLLTLAERHADATVGNETKEQVLRAVAKRLRARHAGDTLIKVFWRLCRIEREVEGGTCDDCGKEDTTVYDSAYGGWFCADCLVENIASTNEEP